MQYLFRHIQDVIVLYCHFHRIVQYSGTGYNFLLGSGVYFFLQFLVINNEHIVTLQLGKGAQNKNRKKCGLLPNRGEGGVSEGSKMPNLYFVVLKRVKNGLKMAKKHIEILYFS